MYTHPAAFNINTPIFSTTNFTYDNSKRPKPWTKDKEGIYQSNIDVDKINHLLKLLNVVDPLATTNYEMTKTNINEIASQLNTLLTDTAENTFGSHIPQQSLPRHGH